MNVRMNIKTVHWDKSQWMRDKSFDKKRVLAGPSGKHAFLARIHEFGCRVPVTEKMRRFLHGNGVHLKKNTRFLLIPERSFLRSGYDATRDKLTRHMSRMWLSKRPAHDELSALGQILQEGIQEYIRAGIAPPKKDFPLSRGTTPLISSGALIDGIQYEVR